MGVAASRDNKKARFAAGLWFCVAALLRSLRRRLRLLSAGRGVGMANEDAVFAPANIRTGIFRVDRREGEILVSIAEFD